MPSRGHSRPARRVAVRAREQPLSRPTPADQPPTPSPGVLARIAEPPARSAEKSSRSGRCWRVSCLAGDLSGGVAFQASPAKLGHLYRMIVLDAAQGRVKQGEHVAKTISFQR